MILLITYDLKQPDRDYTALFNVIKQIGDSWWHYLDSTWIIKTNMSVIDSAILIRKTMDQNDLLFVVDISDKEHEGWLPSKAWEWFKDNR